MTLAGHSLAIMGIDDTVNSLGPYYLICMCGYESEELRTMAALETAALTHKREAEMMGTPERAE